MSIFDNPLICSHCGADTFLVLPIYKIARDENEQLSYEEWPIHPRGRVELPLWAQTREKHIACSRCGNRVAL